MTNGPVATCLAVLALALGACSAPVDDTLDPDEAKADVPAANPDRIGCSQDEYDEELPTNASLSGLKFSEDAAVDYLLGALERRYPAALEIVEGGLASSMSKSHGSCIEQFLDDTSSSESVLRQASTIVHECGHYLDLDGTAGTIKSTYVIVPDELTFTCKKGDTTERSGLTFARSLIRDDDYYASRKACPKGKTGAGCDMYAETYLDGDATDDTFDSGDQGYNFLLEEASQYVNSLATALAFEDQYSGVRVSARDGILTFLWYIERYLAMARTEYPDAYAWLSEDECWRQATLTVWDRGWFYLRQTEGMVNLGLDDAELLELVSDPELVAEIDALRKLECS